MNMFLILQDFGAITARYVCVCTSLILVNQSLIRNPLIQIIIVKFTKSIQILGNILPKSATNN
jgi:hypothetical protein